MKKIFSTCMTILFACTLGLFLTLGIVVIILGPQRTERAIRSLFTIKNYKEDYKKLLPFLAEAPLFEESEDDVTHGGNVLGISRGIRSRREVSPLVVPTSGIAPQPDFLYTGELADGKHEGIDIWTNVYGRGIDGKTYYKGNPVYAACGGVVTKRWDENGDLWILCDKLDFIYEGVVPSRKIMTLYGHMADAQSNDVFIYVNEGDRVKKGQLVGHQGNRCYYSPQNLVVHLHFGVYDMAAPRRVPLDPTPYVGVSCTTVNQSFEAGITTSK